MCVWEDEAPDKVYMATAPHLNANVLRVNRQTLRHWSSLGSNHSTASVEARKRMLGSDELMIAAQWWWPRREEEKR
jgi:hypothetical protein